MNGKNTTWQDPHARRLLAAAVAFAALLGLSGALGGAAAGWAAHRASLRPLATAASALLANGFTPGQAAAALQTQPNSPGWQLVAQMGRDTPTAWGPGVLAGMLAGFLAAFALGLLAVGGVVLWLHGQEARWQQALATVRRCAAGDAAARLPWDGAGTPGALLRAVDGLAAALRAGAERERKSKQFLQETLQDISHQLKTPLAAMALYCQILQADPTDAEAVRRCAVKTAAATERMTRLVRTLLKLAQVDAGGVPFAPALCPLDALAADAAEPLTARAAAEGKALSLEGPDVAALCDRAWTAEAIGNLIKNALDHTGPGGHIAVRWGAGPLGGWVTVQDDGPGIPPQDLPHLFKRFYRGSAPAGEGLGLGLPFAKAVLEAQGGALSVESEPGAGSVFRASLPGLSKL